MQAALRIALTVFSALGLWSSHADAHVIYKDLNQNPTQVSSFLRYGWLDGADADWGDSHNVPDNGGFFKFQLTTPRLVTITFSTASAALNPAFSLYRGEAPTLAHDQAEAYPILLGKEGQFNALGTWTIANDDGEIGTLTYLTHKNDNAGTSETLSNYLLAPGVYTVVASGANCNGDSLLSCRALPSLSGTVSLTTAPAATPVPMPPLALWLMGAALVGLQGIRRGPSMQRFAVLGAA